MEKHVGLNPKWFEPGADGVSRFERLSATVGFGAAGISAAFRALLAEEEQVAPVEQHDERDALINQLRGEVEQGDKHADEIHRLQSELHARNDEITGLRGEVDSVRKSLESTSLAFNETRKQLDQFWNQRDAARAEVERLDKWRVAMNGLTPNGSEYVNDLDRCVSVIRERFESGHEAKKELFKAKDEIHRLQSELHARNDEIIGLRAERDALQARIDGGVQPLEHIADAGKMMDERKGEARRKMAQTFVLVNGHLHFWDWNLKAWRKNERSCPSTNDRRRTPGTRADRRQA